MTAGLLLSMVLVAAVAALTARQLRRPLRRRTLTLIVVVINVFAVLLLIDGLQRLAAAQPAPGGDCPPGSVRCVPAQPSPRPTDPAAAPGSPLTPPPPAGDAAQQTGQSASQPAGKGADQYGVPLPANTSDHPLTAYHVFFDPGGFVPSPFKVAVGALTEIANTVAKNLVAIAVWFLTWAWSFWFAGLLAAPAVSLANAWQTDLISPAGLAVGALVLTGFYLVVQVVRGRTAHGYGEVLVSLLVAALAVFVVPAALFNAAMNTAAKTSATIMVVTTGGDPNTIPAPDTSGSYTTDQYSTYFARYGRTLIGKYVAEPAAILSYGQVPKGRCADLHNQILAEGLGADDDKVRQIMGSDPQCKPLADQTENVAADKLVAAGIHAVASLVILIVVVAVSFPVLAAQIAVAALIIALPIVLILGATPQFRGILHKWAISMIGSVAAICLSSLILGLLVWTGDIVTKALAADNTSMVARTIPYAVPAIAALIFHKRMRRGLTNAMDRVRQRAETARIGGGHSGRRLGRGADSSELLGELLGRREATDTWQQYGTVKGQIHRGRTALTGDRKSQKPGLLLGAPPKKKNALAAAGNGQAAPAGVAGGSLGALVAGTAQLGVDEQGMPVITTVSEKETTRHTPAQTTRKALPAGKAGGKGGEVVQRRGAARTVTREKTTTTRPLTGRAAAAAGGVASPEQRRGLVAARLADGRLGRAVIKGQRVVAKTGRVAGDLTTRSLNRDAEAAGRAAAQVDRRRSQVQAVAARVATAARDPQAAAARTSAAAAARARGHVAQARRTFHDTRQNPPAAHQPQNGRKP